MTLSDSPQTEGRGEAKQFLQLLGMHERRLRAFIFALVPNWADAEEIAQETRIRLWEQFDRYDPAKDFGAWSRTIAYYLVLKEREKASRDRLVFSQEFLERVASEIEGVSDEWEARRRTLAECLQKCSAQQRQLLMRYYEGKESMREIAAQLGRSLDATRQSVLRTRTALAECVESALRREDHS